MKQNNKPAILGVTGGMGAGKSTVTNILRDQGGQVIDADMIARFVVQRSDIQHSIRNAFGDDVFDVQGQLMRKELAKIVFEDISRLEQLNQIMHPAIIAEINRSIEAVPQEDWIVIDAAIPFQPGFLDVCDEIWLVESSVSNRITRLLSREKTTLQDIENRMRMQLSSARYREIAHRVICNDADQATLKIQVDHYLSDFLKGRKR